jgi:hypothetical protein
LETLEEFTRSRIADWIQDLLEEEVVEFLLQGHPDVISGAMWSGLRCA